MVCKTSEFKFDPDKSALENFFALLYRVNHIKLDGRVLDVELPRLVEEDEHGDNTIVVVKAKAGGPFKGSKELYYARADINTHYPDFKLDLAELGDIADKAALMAYLDGRFNLVDGEFDIDVNDPFGSLLRYTHIDLFAKEESLIYIGEKRIEIFWSGGIRRITDEMKIRITDEGLIRIIHNGDLD